jgi:hypothetical protein
MCCCAKLATFDWTKGLTQTDDISKYNVVEVRFKNSHKDFYKNVDATIVLQVGDIVTRTQEKDGWSLVKTEYGEGWCLSSCISKK